MKKVLLTAATVSFLATSSAYAMEDMFYVKANTGWSKLNKVDGVKSKNDVHFGVGAGYQIMDNARVDLTFDHFANPTFKVTGVRLKGDINALLLNGYFDVINVDAVRVFVGAGVGLAQVKAKVTYANSKPSISVKQKNTFAFTGCAGVGYEFTEGVTGELSYSYRDMGKTKKLGDDSKAVNFRGHHLTAGVKFDI